MSFFDRFAQKQTPTSAPPDAYEAVEMPQYADGIDSLGLQLYPADYFEQADVRPAEYVAQEDIPGVATTLIVDRPDSVVLLIDNQAQEWHRHQKQVFSALKQRLAKAAPYDVSYIEIGKADDATDVLAIIEHEDITAATHALVLGELYPQVLGTYGTLVGIPQRHVLMAKKLQTKPNSHEVSVFRDLVQEAAESSDFYVSNAAYIYKNGKFTFAPLST